MVTSRNKAESGLTYEDLEKCQEKLSASYHRSKVKVGLLLYHRLLALPPVEINDSLFPVWMPPRQHYGDVEIILDESLPGYYWEEVEKY